MEQSEDKCNVCRSTQFTAREGYYYCDECGTQSQNVRDLILDQEAIEASQGFFTSTKVLKAKIEKPKLTTWECFNYMLRCTVDVLHNFGAKEELKQATLQIWAAYLRKIEVAFFNKKSVQLPRLGPKYSQRDARLIYNHDKPKRKKSVTSQASGKMKFTKQKKIHAQAEYETMSQATSTTGQSLTGSSASAGSVPGVPIELSRTARRYYKRLMPAQHLKKHEADSTYELKCHSLRNGPKIGREVETLSRRTMQSIIYLALNQCQDDIQLCDLLRLYREGHLPNMKYSHLLPEDIAKNCEEVVSMQEHGKWELYRSSAMRESAANLVRFLHIPEMVLPDLLKLSKRFITDLNLPLKLGSYVERLYNFHPPSMTYEFTNPLTPSYEGRAMAYVIFMLKLMFVLDGEAEQVISNSAKTVNLELKRLGDLDRSVFVWEDWARYIEMRKVILTQCHPPTSIHLGENINYDEFIDYTTKAYTETTDDNIGKIVRNKLMLMQKIFEDLRVKLMKKEHKERVPSLQCPPSLTPYNVYLKYILNDHTFVDKIIIPEFMHDDPSKKDIEPFVDCIELKKFFEANNIQLMTKKVSCKSLRENLGIYKCYHAHTKKRVASSIRLRKLDFDIDEDEWVESLDSWRPSNIFTRTSTRSNVTKRRKKYPIAPVALQEQSYTQEKTRIPADAASVCSLNVFREDNMEPATSDIIGTTPRQIENPNLFQNLADKDERVEVSQNESHDTPRKMIELNVSSFDCWNLLGVKRYMLAQEIEQVERKLPKSFHWLLKTCAEIVEMEVMDLYEEVLAIENEFMYALNPIDNVGDTLSYSSSNYERDMQQIINYYKKIW